MSAWIVPIIAAARKSRKKKFIDHFASKGAISAETAIPRDGAPHADEFLKELTGRKVVVTVAAGRHYLDQERLLEVEREDYSSSLKRALIVFGLLFALIAVLACL